MRQSNRKIARILAITLITAAFFALPAHAQEEEKTIDQIKKRLDSLIITKDEESGGSLAISDRIGLLKDVVGISTKQARDLKARLVIIDYDGEKEIAWRDEMIKKLDEAVTFYSEISRTISEREKEITLEDIISITNNFKQKREEIYLPLIEEINEFILINRTGEIISIANQRLSRIQNDLERLGQMQFKGIDALKSLFKEAEKSIREGNISYNEAKSVFWASYEEEEVVVTDEAPVTASAEAAATSTEASAPLPAEAAATSTEAVEPEEEEIKPESEEEEPEEIPQPQSIKNLASFSLNEIREAYRIFIEMSNLVRELL